MHYSPPSVHSLVFEYAVPWLSGRHPRHSPSCSARCNSAASRIRHSETRYLYTVEWKHRNSGMECNRQEQDIWNATQQQCKVEWNATQQRWNGMQHSNSAMELTWQQWNGTKDLSNSGMECHTTAVKWSNSNRGMEQKISIEQNTAKVEWNKRSKRSQQQWNRTQHRKSEMKHSIAIEIAEPGMLTSISYTNLKHTCRESRLACFQFSSERWAVGLSSSSLL